MIVGLLNNAMTSRARKSAPRPHVGATYFKIAGTNLTGFVEGLWITRRIASGERLQDRVPGLAHLQLTRSAGYPSTSLTGSSGDVKLTCTITNQL